MYDDMCEAITAANPNMLVPWWIMAAWSYEVASIPIISDACFDKLVIRLDKEWDNVSHTHKHLLDKSMLKSSLAIGGSWPNLSIGAANFLIKTKPS